MPAWLQRDWCSSFVLALGHFLWQGTLIALVLAIALRATKTVAVRYWLSLAALLLMAVSPAVTLGWLLRPMNHVVALDAQPIVREEPAPTSSIAPATSIEEPSDVGQVSNLPVNPPTTPLNFHTATTIPLPVSADDRSWWQKFAPHLTTTYLCGVMLMLLRLVFGLWGGRRLRRRVHLIDDPSLLAAMRRQATALGLKLLPVLAYCERVTVPTVVGVLKPMILLPLTLTSGLSPEQMESVLAHELAHLRRYDHLVNLLQRVIESLLFFHPALWWVSHRIRDEREHCCDDLVVACGAMPLDYAKSLLVVAELSRASARRGSPDPAAGGGSRAGRGSPDPALGSVGAVSLLATGSQKPSHLRQRIARLLGESATPSLRVSPRALLLAIGIPLVALIVTIQSGAGRGSPDDSAGRGSPDPALAPTAGLPNSDEQQRTTEGDGSEFLTPKSLEAFLPKDFEKTTRKWEDIVGRLRQEESKFSKIEAVMKTRQEPTSSSHPLVQKHLNRVVETVRRVVSDGERSYYKCNAEHRDPSTGDSVRFLTEETTHGRWLRRHYESSGKDSPTHKDDSVILLPKSEHRLRPHTVACADFFTDPPKSLSDLLTDETPGRRKTIELLGEERIGGDRCVKLKVRDVSSGQFKGYSLLWLAIKKNLLPIRRELHANDPQSNVPVAVTLTTELTELRADFWYPKKVEGYLSRRLPSEPSQFKVELTPTTIIEKVVLNPVVDPKLFEKLGQPPGDGRGFNDSANDSTGNKNGDLRSDQPAGSGDPRRAQVAIASEETPKEYGPQDWGQWFINTVQYRKRKDGSYSSESFKHLRKWVIDDLSGEPNAPGAAEARAWLEATAPDKNWAEEDFQSLVERIGTWRLSVIQRALPDEGAAGRSFPKPGRPATADELRSISFGRAAENGLRIAWVFDPAKKNYAIGESLKCRVMLHNSGSQPVQFVAWDVLDGVWTIRDATGKPIQSEDVDHRRFWNYPRMATYQRYRLAPGHVVEIHGKGIGIGEADHSAAKNQAAIWRIIHARAGDSVEISVETKLDLVHRSGEFSFDGFTVDEFPEEKARDWSGSLRSGEVKFNIVAAAAKDVRPDAATGDLPSKDRAISPPKGLEFLTPYPKLHGLSLDMTESRFLEIVKQQELKTMKTDEGDKTAYHIGLGDGLTLIVMFRQDGTCRGIQRIRGEEEKVSGETSEARVLRKPALLLPDHWIVQAVGFGHEGKELVTASNQSFITIRRWDVVNKKLISEIKLQADKHGRAVRDGTLMFSGDRRRVVAATDEYVGIWDATTGKLLKQLPFQTKEGIYSCAIDMLDATPDFSVIVGHRALPGRLTLSFDAHLIVWDGLSGNVLQTVIDKGATDLKALDLSTDGKRLVTTNGGGAKIWETSTGQLLRSILNDNTGRKHSEPDVSSQYTSHVWSVQLSPDGQQLAMGDILGVKLLDATSGKLLQQLEGPYRYSSSGSPGLVFSKDGQWLARLGTQEKVVVNGDKHRYVVPIWSTRTGTRLFELHTEANDATFSDDGQRLAVVFSDMQQALSVWPLSGDAANVEQTAGPGPHSRQDRVEENGHYVGKTAAEFIDKFQPTWGDTKLGLQYGIALTKPQQRKFRSGERVPLVAFFRNASDKPIKFDTAPDFFGNTPKVFNAKDEPIALENIPLLGHIPHYHEQLAPGEALGPFYLSVGLGENPRPGQQHWYPYFKTPIAGQYKLTHSVSINVTSSKESDRSKRDDVTNSPIEFEIIDTPNGGAKGD